MKLLLDENLPHDLRKMLTGHEVFTVKYMGWLGVENGRLLELAVREGFAVILTLDAGIEHERDVASYPIGVMVLHAASSAIEHVGLLAPDILSNLSRLQPRRVLHVGKLEQ